MIAEARREAIKELAGWVGVRKKGAKRIVRSEGEMMRCAY